MVDIVATVSISSTAIPWRKLGWIIVMVAPNVDGVAALEEVVVGELPILKDLGGRKVGIKVDF